MAGGRSATARDLSGRFFHDPYVQKIVSKIAKQDTLVVYAGLGVTIDRTQKSWPALISGLLEKPELKLTDEDRLSIFRLAEGNTIAAASIAWELYQDCFGTTAEDTIRAELQKLLYPTLLLADDGRLISAIASLLDAWGKAGKTVILVTPNYENLLLERLRAFSRIAPEEIHVDSSTNPSQLTAHVLGSTGIKYVYLHGSIPRFLGTFTNPVITETDYHETEQIVRGVLTELQRQASFLSVGTSLSDPPLVASLLASKGSGHSRWSIIPLQDAMWSRDLKQRERQVRYHTLRMRHLGIDEPIYADYYGQVAQFIDEVRECSVKNQDYHSPTFTTRYGQRLNAWWDNWLPSHGTESAQQLAHEQLAALLTTEIIPSLSPPADENLKLELWLRWSPRTERRLGLWASSLGTWRDVDTMRWADIEFDSEYVAAQVFCRGQTVAPTKPVNLGRWQTFVGIPLLHEISGSVPEQVGAAVLASMKPPSESVISDSTRAANLAFALKTLRDKATLIALDGRYT